MPRDLHQGLTLLLLRGTVADAGVHLLNLIQVPPCWATWRNCKRRSTVVMSELEGGGLNNL